MPDALTDNHHSTLHAFFLAAKEGGYTEFELQLVASPKGRVEFCISPREHSEMGAKFEVRGNMIRAAANEASVVPADDTDFEIYGGTRSGEAPLRVAPSPRNFYIAHLFLHPGSPAHMEPNNAERAPNPTKR